MISKKPYLFVILFISSCVTPKVHNALMDEHELLKQKLLKIEKKEIALSDEVAEKKLKIKNISDKIIKLKDDSIFNGKSLASLERKYDELNNAYDVLTSESDRFMANKAKETKKLLNELEQSKSSLFEKEDQLKKLENSLAIKEEELLKIQLDLNSRSKRVTDLEKTIESKDSIVGNIKKSISKALSSLEGQGLTIEKRDGKVYISLEEKLLFASGKYTVSTSGRDALNKLASALALQKNVEILVEGHTDSIPFNGKTLKDNWDLSVMRATNVIKILVGHPEINPSLLTAAGKGEFSPIQSNSTKEGRKSNRRIEMVLSPNLDDLFDLLDDSK